MNFIDKNIIGEKITTDGIEFVYEKVIAGIMANCASSPKLAKECLDAQLSYHNFEVKDGKF